MTAGAGSALGAGGRSPLSLQVGELYDDPRLMPMLRKLVKTTCTMAGGVGGSVSMVDSVAGRYTKVAELGTSCRLGQSFPLSEGVTGQVMSRRGPVVLRTYREISVGHLTAGHPASDGAVAAIPLWWRGDIVAVNVIFAGVARPFSMDEVDHLELVTQVMAPGLVSAMEREFPTAEGLQRSEGGNDAGRVPSGDPRPPRVSVDEVTQGLLSLAERTAVGHSTPVPYLHVAVYGGGGAPRLLIRQDGPRLTGEESKVGAADSSVWHEVVDGESGGFAIHELTRSVADLAESGTLIGLPLAGAAGATLSPFSARELEVAGLLAHGLSDRRIAAELCLSPKTVEKHVGAVLRKTATTSRTAAVVHCIQQRWLTAGTSAALGGFPPWASSSSRS